LAYLALGVSVTTLRIANPEFELDFYNEE